MKDIRINSKDIVEENYDRLVNFLNFYEYDFKEIDERDEMLSDLSHYVCNDGDELPRILDTLLEYDGDSDNVYEICPDIILWQPVENWSYSQLMGAIS